MRVDGVRYRLGLGVEGLLGVKGLAAGLNSLALGLRVDFFSVCCARSTAAAARSLLGDADDAGDEAAVRSSAAGDSDGGAAGGCDNENLVFPH